MKVLSAGVLGLVFLAVMGCGPESGSSSSSSGAVCDPAAPYAFLDARQGSRVMGLLEGYEALETQRGMANFGKDNFAALATAYQDHLAVEIQTLGTVPAWEDSGTPSALHTEITNALTQGQNPQDTTPPRELWQQVQKNVLRAFFLMVLRDVRRGTAADLDAAYVLFGHGDGSSLSRLAGELAEYDADLGVAQEPLALDALKAARCAVVRGDTAALTAAADALDAAGRKGFAYAAAHYFQQLSTGSGDRVQLVEGAVWFGVVEGWMRSQGHATEANQIRGWLNPLLPGGAMETATPDTAGATAALNAMRTVFGLNI